MTRQPQIYGPVCQHSSPKIQFSIEFKDLTWNIAVINYFEAVYPVSPSLSPPSFSLSLHMYTDTINSLFSCKQHCRKSPRFTDLQSHKVKHDGTHTHTPCPDTGLRVIPLSCLCHLQIRLAHISSAIVIARPRACYCSSLAWWRHAHPITNKPRQMQRKVRWPQAKKKREIERVSGF